MVRTMKRLTNNIKHINHVVVNVVVSLLVIPATEVDSRAHLLHTRPHSPASGWRPCTDVRLRLRCHLIERLQRRCGCTMTPQVVLGIEHSYRRTLGFRAAPSTVPLSFPAAVGHGRRSWADGRILRYGLQCGRRHLRVRCWGLKLTPLRFRSRNLSVCLRDLRRRLGYLGGCRDRGVGDGCGVGSVSRDDRSPWPSRVTGIGSCMRA